MLLIVRHSNALPVPPPMESMSRSERTWGMRCSPTVVRKWSAKADPRWGVAMVVTESTVKERSVMCEVR